LGSVTAVWTLTPGVGWSVTDFRYQNGFTQGTLPAVPVTTNSLPDLKLVSVDSPTTAGLPIPVGTGAQSFRATVQNIGTADFTQTTTVTFVLTDTATGAQLGAASGPIGPIAVGKSAQVTVSINIPTTLSAVTQAQVSASVNTGCPIPESDCTNNGGTFPVVITPASVPLPDLRTQITNVNNGAILGTGPQTIQATVTNHGNAPFTASPQVNFAVVVAGNTVASAQVTITGPIAVNQVVPVQATLNIPLSIPSGTAATLTVDASPTCPNPVEPDCTDNTATLSITIGIPPAIIITSSRGNTASANAVELNGILPEALTLTATRSDNITTGSVTLTLTDSPQVANNPAQFTSIPYGAPQAADFFATLDAGGNVTTGPTTAQVTPSNPVPAAGLQPTTLFYNIGDINLSLPSGTICIPIGAGNLAPVPSFSINVISGFNVPTVSWQWAGLSGVTVNQVSGTATLSGPTYALPAFTFTVTTPGAQTPLFAVTVTNAQGSATKAFALSFNLSATPCAGAALRLGGSGGVTGTWSRGALGGGMAKAAGPAGPLPDLQINAASVSFTPSIPKPGDTVSVRFRVTNAGNADAQHVPIALVVGGVTVASETFDIRAGASTLAALEWPDAHTASSSGSLQAAVVVDPNHTVVEKSALAKSAPLVHFAWLPGSGAQTGAPLAAAQRATLELADGGCAGFSFASGAGSACGSADVEISVEQMASGRFTLAAQIGIADLGPAFGGGKLAVVQYQPEAPAVAGHSYAVQLRGGKTGILRLAAIRNPGQTAAKSSQVFGAGKVAGKVGAGQSSGPVETGDVSGVRTQSQSKAYFDVSYQTQ
ncbi:MAG: CARDB domain-containing protein, partial [Terriglobales bacterium]